MNKPRNTRNVVDEVREQGAVKAERFDVGDDPEHPGFSMMHPAPGGHWVRFECFNEVRMERDEEAGGAVRVLESESVSASAVQDVLGELERRARETHLEADACSAMTDHGAEERAGCAKAVGRICAPCAAPAAPTAPHKQRRRGTGWSESPIA